MQHVTKRACDIFLLGAMAAIAARTQTFTSLVSFDGPNGANPLYGSLVQGVDGNFYGTTQRGESAPQGTTYFGTIFVMTPQGQLRTLYGFANQITEGSGPDGGLIVAPNGLLYGTTVDGGANVQGNVFQVTPGGVLTTLHNFDHTDGAAPADGLVQAFNGMLYGTTSQGGAGSLGTVFRLTTGGTLATLYSFSGPDGAESWTGLVQAANGRLYGTTHGGGAHECGTIFTVSPSGAFKTLHNFNNKDGHGPAGALIQGSDGNFYGTTSSGGANGYGTVFQITAAGAFTTLHSFANTDGAAPTGALVEGTDGNFYGTTSEGGTNGNNGTIFQITPSGTLTNLHDFDGADGATPFGGLVQGTDGNFYGTTNSGGSRTFYGTVFRLSMGLGPFVATLPTFGKVGADVTILGTDLTGAASVTFNGVAASFTVVSPTAIKTTVPSAATTGMLQVVTRTGTLASNARFQVLRQQ
jgi:uncharacterized repeat protein (TIGR03803 family)